MSYPDATSPASTATTVPTPTAATPPPCLQQLKVSPNLCLPQHHHTSSLMPQPTLLPPRLPPPSSSPTTPQLKVSRELGVLQRRVHRGVRDMHRAVAGLRGAGLPEAEVGT